MVDTFLFGTYYSYNENLDPNRTRNRESTKWRSQFKVPQGSIPYGDVNEWWYIGDKVHLINISDLDYQLKIKEIPFNSNEDWVRRVEGTIRISEEYIGINPVVNFFANDFPPASEENPNPQPFPTPAVFAKPYTTPEFIDFVETRLELGYDYGAVGGVEFQTEIIEVADDREQRQALRAKPLGRWQLGERLMGESEVDKLAEVSYLKQFHIDRLGARQGFRFKDWADYKAVEQLIGVGDDNTTAWQLRKAYYAGSTITYRPIQKPVVGTVALYVDGVNVAVDPDHSWIVNHESGVISNETPLNEGSTLSASFKFDVPVWFESDELPLTLEKFYPDTEEYYYKLGSVFVVEGRIPFAIPWTINPIGEITEELDLGIIYQTVEKYKFSTNKLNLKSGYTRRESKREDTRILFDLGDRKYDQKEVDQILGYFWNANGQAREFPFVNLGKNYKVRFNSDAINFKFEAATADDALFSLSGLKLQLKEQTLYRLPPYNFPLTTTTVNPQDPNDPVIAASNPSSGDGGDGGGSGGGGGGAYGIASHVGAVGFNQLPDPNVSPFDGRWRAAQMFWAAGSLWLVIRSEGNSVANNNWFNRAALYKLNAAGNFEYIDSNLKNYYGGSISGSDSTRILKTPTGISLFTRANNSVPFGSGRATTENGLLRFEIKNDGSQAIYFYSDAALKPSFGASSFKLTKCVAIYGNRAYIDVGSSTSNVGFVAGTFDGLEFALGNWGNGSASYPVNSESPSNPDNEILRESEPYNLYWKTVLPYREIYYGETLLEKYFRVGQLTPSVRYTQQNPDGSIMARLYLNGVCPDGTCNNNFDSRAEYFHSVFNLESYTDIPVNFGRIKRPTSSNDATFKFLTRINSGLYTRFVADDKGNALVIESLSKCYFYRAGDTFAINISAQLPGNLRTNEAPTPFGFAVFSHSSDMFYNTSKETLIFVQPTEA